MSQKELADKIDVSSSFISQVENNLISPSLSSFTQICKALGAGPSALLDDKPTKKADWLIRKRNDSLPLLKEDGLAVFNVTSNSVFPKGAGVNIAVIEPHTQLRKHVLLHKGKEYIYVLKGSVSVVVDNVSERLSAGDSVFFKGEIPTMWGNDTEDEVELLIIHI